MQPTIHLEGIYRVHIQLYVPNVLWVAFSIPPGSLSLVKYPVYREIQFPKDDSTTNFLNHTIFSLRAQYCVDRYPFFFLSQLKVSTKRV
jgi:hypothetical protein